MKAAEAGLLGLLIHARGGVAASDAVARLHDAGAKVSDVEGAVKTLAADGKIRQERGRLEVTDAGVSTFLAWHAVVTGVEDPWHDHPDFETCPSVPFLTTVQTEWIEAISLNYRVDANALQTLLPAPLAPDIAHGTGWVQILMSSLRDMRPQGLGAVFGTNFYQVSYRAAVTLATSSGKSWRGGYFLRSETNDSIMRVIGNSLKEFKFHAFGHADMLLAREGARLVASIESRSDPGGDLVAIATVDESTTPPIGSVWSSLAELETPLVACYDAFAVDGKDIYVLTIDREPWAAKFCRVDQLFSQWIETGPLAGKVVLDSALHVPRCAYKWRPLRRLRA